MIKILTYGLAVVLPVALATTIIVVGGNDNGKHVALRLPYRTRFDRWLNVFAERHPDSYRALRVCLYGTPAVIVIMAGAAVVASFIADSNPEYAMSHQGIASIGQDIRSVFGSLRDLFG